MSSSGADAKFFREFGGETPFFQPVLPHEIAGGRGGLERLVKMRRREVVDFEYLLTQRTLLATGPAGAGFVFDDDVKPLPKRLDRFREAELLRFADE